MRIQTKTYTRTVSSAQVEAVGDFELSYPVADWMDQHIEVVGDKAVIGYLVSDSGCENPMTSCDGMGEFITDDDRRSNWYAHLGLESSSYRGEIFRDLECDGVYEGAVNLLKQRLITDNDFLDYCEENFERVGDEDKADMAFMESCIDQIDWGKYGTAIPAWLEAIWEVAQDDAWDKLQSEGKIGTYLAVPCCWNDNVHGPGTAQAYTTTIEDANAVWIPTQCDLDNIVSPGDTYEQSYAKAVKYAEGVLEEYVKWARGETYGIVVETYTRSDEDSEWKLIDSDNCWGFIGMDYAEEAMKGLFDSVEIY